MNLGAGAYFASTWNAVDALGFGLELAGSLAWLARADPAAVRGLLAVAALLLIVKVGGRPGGRAGVFFPSLLVFQIILPL